MGTDEDANLGSDLGLVSLLRVVRSDTLRLDALCILINFIVRAEQVDLIVVILSRGSSRTTEESFAGSAGTRERVELRLVGLDVVEPAGYAGEGRGRRRSDRLEDGDIGLGRGVSGEDGSANKSKGFNASVGESEG